MTLNEIPHIHTWLKEMLSSDPTLSAAVSGVYRGHVPKGKALPAVVFSFLAAQDDLHGGGSARIWTKCTFIVKVVGLTNNDTTLQTIADRIETVLHATAGATGPIAVDYCIRRRPVYYQENPAPETWFTHLGGEFELAARAV